MKYSSSTDRKRVRAWLLGLAVAVATMGVSLEQETLAGIKVGDEVKKVFSLHGTPDVTKRLGNSPEIGGELVIYGYRSLDLRFLVLERPDTGGKVYSISALGKSKAETSRGIRIGSTRDEVEAVYGGLTHINEDNYMVGIDEGGRMMAFTIRDGEVVKIVLSQIPG